MHGITLNLSKSNKRFKYFVKTFLHVSMGLKVFNIFKEYLFLYLRKERLLSDYNKSESTFLILSRTIH